MTKEELDLANAEHAAAEIMNKTRQLLGQWCTARIAENYTHLFRGVYFYVEPASGRAWGTHKYQHEPAATLTCGIRLADGTNVRIGSITSADPVVLNNMAGLLAAVAANDINYKEPTA